MVTSRKVFTWGGEAILWHRDRQMTFQIFLLRFPLGYKSAIPAGKCHLALKMFDGAYWPIENSNTRPRRSIYFKCLIDNFSSCIQRHLRRVSVHFQAKD